MAASTPHNVTTGPGLEAHVVVRRGEFSLDVDLATAPGEVTGVLGPNGAGKTTLLRALMGLLPLDGGRVALDGGTLDDPAQDLFVAPERRAVGLLFQDYLLFPHLSVLDNVAFGLRTAGRPRAKARRDASAWLDRFGVAELAQRRPGALSGGQAQRVALARAVARTPSLLLLDEPLAALDAGTRLEVRSELRRHLTSFGGSSVVVTHDPLEAMVLADQLIVIEDGRVVQRGPPSELARRPLTEYGARLVGVNLLRGRAAGRQVVLEAGLTVVTAETRASGQVLVVVRPEAIALTAERPHPGIRNCWTGSVENLELLGSKVRVTVRGGPPVRVDVTPAEMTELHLQLGEPVWLSVNDDAFDVYPDPAAGIRQG